jgi:hypothetical protein
MTPLMGRREEECVMGEVGLPLSVRVVAEEGWRRDCRARAWSSSSSPGLLASSSSESRLVVMRGEETVGVRRPEMGGGKLVRSALAERTGKRPLPLLEARLMLLLRRLWVREWTGEEPNPWGTMVADVPVLGVLPGLS